MIVAPTAFWVRLKLPHLRPVVEFITLLPLVIPPIVIVFGYIRLFNTASILPLTGSERGTDFLLTAGYATLALPYLYRAIDTGLRAIDVRSLAEAAQSLGAGWARILFRIILPNIRSALLSGAFLTFAIVIGEFTMAALLDRPAGDYNDRPPRESRESREPRGERPPREQREPREQRDQQPREPQAQAPAESQD